MKAFIAATSLVLMVLNGAWGQAQLTNEVVLDTLNQAGTPIHGVPGAILSYDFDTVREIHRVEAAIDVERLTNPPDAPQIATVTLVVGIWNSGEFFFNGEFGDWATLAGNYFVATNSVQVRIPRTNSHTKVLIAVTMPRESFYTDADVLIGLFPQVSETPDSGTSTLRARVLGSAPAVSQELLKTFQIPFGPFGLELGPSYDTTPNIKITTRQIVTIDSQPRLTFRRGGSQLSTALTMSWSTKFPGWSIQWDYEPTFSSAQYIVPDDIFEQTKNSNPQPANPDADVYSFEVPQDESGLPRYFRLFYWDITPYVPRLPLEQSGFGGPPIVPLPQP